MGMDQKTVQNCLVYKVDPARHLLYVRGQVPGPAGQFVHLRDAVCVPRAVKEAWGPRPYPTCLPAASSSSSSEEPSVYRSPKDPYRPYQEEGADYFGVEWSKSD
jgi:large subunit ribosomal protein L3